MQVTSPHIGKKAWKTVDRKADSTMKCCTSTKKDECGCWDSSPGLHGHNVEFSPLNYSHFSPKYNNLPTQMPNLSNFLNLLFYEPEPSHCRSSQVEQPWTIASTAEPPSLITWRAAAFTASTNAHVLTTIGNSACIGNNTQFKEEEKRKTLPSANSHKCSTQSTCPKIQNRRA